MIERDPPDPPGRFRNISPKAEAAEPVDESTQGQGTVVEEMVTCGDESCKCMTDGKKHGPYKYRYYREGGRLTSEYFGKS